jgi:hypothetical protein
MKSTGIVQKIIVQSVGFAPGAIHNQEEGSENSSGQEYLNQHTFIGGYNAK